MSDNVIVYEYVVVQKEWWDNLERGTRLYYDYNKNGYVYHYESSRTQKNDKYDLYSSTIEDYFISHAVAGRGLRTDCLVAGPVLGEYVLGTAKIVVNS